MDKDRLDIELKSIMEDETKDIEISQELKNKILLRRKKSLRDKIKDFLNREIQIPLMPMVGSLILALVITSVPRDLMIKDNIRVVNIGSSQMIFRGERRVSGNDEN